MAPTSWEAECNAHIAWAEMLVEMMHPEVTTEDWSGLKSRVAEAKFLSQPGRRADGIAQFHPPVHPSAEARRRTGWQGIWAKAKFF